MRSNRGKTVILTSSPYKDELESQEKPKKKVQEKPSRKVKAPPKNKVEATKKPKLTKPTNRIFEESSSSEDEPDSPDACVYCNALTIESKKEGLIQCVKCKCFAHVICAKAEEEDQNFVCFLCETLRV
uniref:Zinc finger PHD-type domain-containing protein n=1 Tax=Cacopsylla melanoneura TaxID=428564 RepID=A0A8D9DTM9_9HEMI